MVAMGWSTEGGSKQQNFAASMVAKEKAENASLRQRIDALNAAAEERRRKHQAEVSRLKAELTIAKTAGVKGERDKAIAEKDARKLERDKKEQQIATLSKAMAKHKR